MNIVIKLPEKVRDIVQAYPFLHYLEKTLNHSKNSKESEGNKELEAFSIHFIVSVHSKEVLYLLPFKAFYHDYNASELKNIFDAHRFIANSKIPTGCVYISMTEGFIDASLGLMLRSKVRVGLKLKLNKFLLTDTVSLLSGRKKSEQYFELLRPFFKENFENESFRSRFLRHSFPNDIPCVASKSLSQNDLELADFSFVVVDLELDSQGRISNTFSDLFDLCEDEIFVLMSSKLMEDKLLEAKGAGNAHEWIDEYTKVLHDYSRVQNAKNRYEVFRCYNLISFAKVVYKSKAFLSFNNKYVDIASYCGCTIFHFDKEGQENAYGNEFFYSKLKHFNLNGSTYAAECGMSKAFDETIEYIEDRKETNATK